MSVAALPEARPGARVGWPVVLLALLAFAFLAHIAVVAKTVPLLTVVEALVAPADGEFDHIIIWSLRLPRAVAAVMVGAGLAVAGALMQGVTRNPLAEPGLLGLLSGASFAVGVTVGFFGLAAPDWVPLIAAVGALAAAALVWVIAAHAGGGSTPMTLILSGAAVTALLAALVTLVNLLDEQTFEQLRVWLTGTLAGRRVETLLWAAPWMLAGLVVALGAARQVTALSMGEETAIGLGVDVARLRLLILFAVVVLTAGSVAIAGPMGFVGLVVPHVARMIFGHDYRLIVPTSAFCGAIFLLVADIVARMALAPIEVSTGIVTALVGGPVFVWLVRTRL